MQENKPPRLGPLELKILAWAQLKKLPVIRAKEIQQSLALSPSQIREVLSRLKRNGIILRLSRGIYLIPDKLPPGGRWGPNRLWVLNQLMQIYKAEYQITGLEAFNRHGISNQVPNVTTLYNTRLSGRRTIGSAEYVLIKVPSGRLGGTELVSLKDGGTVPFPNLARTLVDGVYDWSRFNLLPECLDRIAIDAKSSGFQRELLKTAIQYGNIGTLRRIGYVLETRAPISRTTLRLWEKAIPKRRSLISLDPSLPRKGKSNLKWGIIEND